MGRFFEGSGGRIVTGRTKGEVALFEISVLLNKRFFALAVVLHRDIRIAPCAPVSPDAIVVGDVRRQKVQTEFRAVLLQPTLRLTAG